MKSKNRVGEIFISNKGEVIKIIEYFNTTNCTIIINDKHIVYNKQYNNIKTGVFKSPYFPSVHGVGFLGIGKYKSTIDGEKTKSYSAWSSMLTRCYNKRAKKRDSSYINCKVCEEWHNFQVFAQWYEENWKPHMEGWHLDKDILFKGNKVYSPETCCFVPASINGLFIKKDFDRGLYPIGVTFRKNRNSFLASLGKLTIGYFKTPEQAFQAYKTVKEAHIKEVAEVWKPKLATKTYEALINYQVEITD